MRNWRPLGDPPPRPVQPQPTDADTVAAQVAAYRRSLLAQGIPEELADKLTIEFQNRMLSLAASVIGVAIGIQNK